MLTIYAIPLSLYCAKLRILLRYKQLVWRELSPPGGYGSSEYETIVPSGNLPALLDDDLLIADSEAIAEYLNEKHPHPPMLPTELVLRAKTREMSRFHDTRLEPELRKLFPFIDEAKHNESIINSQSLAIQNKLQQLANILSSDQPRCGDMLTLGDCGYAVTFTWLDMLTPVLELNIEKPEAVIEYHERLSHYPAIFEELEAYRPQLAAWLKTE